MKEYFTQNYKLVSILFLFSYYSNAQKFDFIKHGLDSIALSNHIKSKHEVIIEIDSSSIDTTIKFKYDYFSNGYLKRYEELDLKNLDTLGIWFWGYHFIEYKYNDKGYLIDKKERWDGPVNVPASSDSSKKTTTKLYKNGILDKEIIINSEWYSNQVIWTDTTLIIYNQNHLISEIQYSPYPYKETYIYDKKNLLIRVEYSNFKRIFKRREIMYEYY